MAVTALKRIVPRLLTRNLDSSDFLGDLSVICLCPFDDFLCRSVIILVIYLPFSDFSLPIQ